MNAMYQELGVRQVRHFSGLMKNLEHLILNDGIKAEDAMAKLRQDSRVEYVQPNYILRVLPVNADPGPVAAAPPSVCFLPGVQLPPGCIEADGSNRPALQPAPEDVNPPVEDPDLSLAYGLATIGATQAWNTNVGSKDIIVADIDTGADYNHEDLAFNMWRNPNPSSAGDVVGYDFIHNDGLPYDDNEHGTHTAGTIGAVGGNGIGISGVSPRVSLMAVKFLSGEGSGVTSDAIKAINYAVANGARVLNNSWGGPADPNNQALSDAIDQARQKGVLFVAAAGNDGKNSDTSSSPSYPASFKLDNILSVAATDSNDRLASFSDYGPTSVHVAAPGVNVYSTVPKNKYKKMSGTSMASPHVAGAAALVWANHPSWTYQQVKKALMDTVDPIDGLQGKVSTGGRINVLKAISASE
ncbi:unnamed protein product [Sphagnum jensenii]|uniref:Peptidase S8/S53 domain-containing protein n=1 Tax=Sphagnum jensenii TaxID=128206 RepID=A0ABP0VHY4_9BRYO